jgi:hypothetical protein
MSCTESHFQFKTLMLALTWRACAYIQYALIEGPAATRGAISSFLNTTGIVSALLSALIVTALSATPSCSSVNTACSVTERNIAIYSGIHGVALMLCLSSIIYFTTTSSWLNLHRDVELCFFIRDYLFVGLGGAIVSMTGGLMCVTAAELLRLWMVYGSASFWPAVGILICSGYPICSLALRIVLTTLTMRMRCTEARSAVEGKEAARGDW